MTYDNSGCPSNIQAIWPQGTNSTMFTDCCGSAICDDEKTCPKCGRNVVGWDAESKEDRKLIRWRNATRFWKRSDYRPGGGE